ncbi:MAG: hypothetical protein K5836_06245 [Clostridiales bacterium]|nr:hypothetical protein [Clostridiales bacterium]
MAAANKLTFKTAIIGFISILLIVYIIYQAYMIIYDPVGTETAYEYTYTDTIDTEVFVARSESYVVNRQKGTIVSAVENGSRVSKGEEVAHIFAETEAADTYLKLREVDEQIERYSRLAAQSDNYVFNVRDLERYIDEEAIGLVKLVSERDFTSLDENVNELRNRIVTKQISTGSKLDFEAKLASLKSQRESLEQLSTKHRNVIASESGYYISGADGYESVVDCAEIKNITPDEVKAVFEAKPSPVPEGAIGRIVTEFNWYFLFVVDAKQAAGLSVGKEITVNLPYSSVNSVKAKVYTINENHETGEMAIVIACNLMNPDVASLRHETAEIVIASHTGLKIPSSALRVNDDGEKGVYVLSGNIAKFRKVNIVYSEDDFVLSRAEEGQEGYVRLYDNIITEGKDLYDGKIVK